MKRLFFILVVLVVFYSGSSIKVNAADTATDYQISSLTTTVGSPTANCPDGTVTITWQVSPQPPSGAIARLMKSTGTTDVKVNDYSVSTSNTAHVCGKAGDVFDVLLLASSASDAQVLASSEATVGGESDSNPSSGSNGAGGAGSAPFQSDNNTSCQQKNGQGYQFCGTLFGNQITARQYFTNLYVWAIGLAIFSASLMIIYGGYKYTTSRGNPSAISDAKDIILNSLLGLALLLLTFVILHFLGIHVQEPTQVPGQNNTETLSNP